MKPLCTKPWTRLYVTTNGDCYNCCYQTKPFHNIKKSNLPFEAAWNNDNINHIRSELMERRMPSCCDCINKHGHIPPSDPMWSHTFEIPDIKEHIFNPEKVLTLTTCGQIGAEPLYRLLMLHDSFIGSGNGEYRPLAHLNKDLLIPEGKIYVQKCWEPAMIDEIRYQGGPILVIARHNHVNHFVNYKNQFNKTVYEFVNNKQIYYRRYLKHKNVIDFDDVIKNPQQCLNRICKIVGLPHQKIDITRWNVENKFTQNQIIDDEEHFALLQIYKKQLPHRRMFTKPPRFVVTAHSYKTHCPYSLLYVIDWPNVIKTVQIPYPKASGMAWIGDRLWIACYNDIVVFDRDLNECKKISNNLFTDLHNIFVHNGSIYASATSIDSVVQVDYDGNLLNLYSMNEIEGYEAKPPDATGHYKKLYKGISPFYHWHVNDMFVYHNLMYVSCLKKGRIIINLDTKEGEVISDIRGHDLQLYGNSLYSTTPKGHITAMNLSTQKSRSFLPHYISKQHWHRGLLKFDTDFIIGGSDTPESNVQPCISWIRDGEVKDVVYLPRAWECNAIHEMEWI